MSFISRITGTFRADRANLPRRSSEVYTGQRAFFETPQDTYSFLSKKQPEDIEPGSPLNKYKPNKRFNDEFDRTDAFWSSNFGKDSHVSPWKLHIYSDNLDDYHRLIDTIGPYLNDRQLSWKTTADDKFFANLLENLNQRGKAVTIYPASDAQMEQTARDLDYIIRNNGLELGLSSIKGDRKMGNTGRIFYRYQYYTGIVKNTFFDMKKAADRINYEDYYDANRGRNQYLADDMTPDDDPWLNFNPSDPASLPVLPAVKKIAEIPDENSVIKLEKNMPYPIKGNETLYLSGNTEVNLAHPEIAKKLDALPDGGVYKIGRNPENDLLVQGSTISRRHAEIIRTDGKLYIQDLSLNGTCIKKG